MRHSIALWAAALLLAAAILTVSAGAEALPGPSAGAKIIDVPYIYQNIDYPNGCESVSTVMALQYWGMDITVDTFIDDYLDRGITPEEGGIGPDPGLVYCGDPRLESGWGCYAPVIINALNKFIDGSRFTVSSFSGKPLSDLCTDYLCRDIPVILWATVGMVDTTKGDYYAHWTTADGKPIEYNAGLHCLLLVGYDEDCYYFNDPMHMNEDGTSYTGYPKAAVEKAYSILDQQCVVICPVPNERDAAARPLE